MKKNLMSIAMGLSDKEIIELVRLKKTGGKKMVELRRERKKLLTSLARIDKKIATFGGVAVEETVEEAPVKTRRGKGRGRKAAKPATKAAKATKSDKVAKKAAKAPKAPKAPKATKIKRGRKGGRRIAGLTDAVRKVVAGATQPMRASDIVDALPGSGFKVADVSMIRKRVSIILATQKGSFKQVGRGLYQTVS